MQLKQKRILLTGATGGLGQALAQLLVAQGAILCLVGRDEQKLARLQASLQAQHAESAQMTYVVADFSLPNMAAQVVEQAVTAMGAIEILINNAGVIDFCAMETQSDDIIAEILHTNVTATVQLSRHILALFKARNQGHFLFVGSIFGSLGFPHFATYCASKFAVHGFSQALRRELVDSKIGVTYIAPRAIATAMNDARTNAMWQASGQSVDAPLAVAEKIVKALVAEKQELFIGQPQSFFAWLNGFAPRFVNIGLKKQAAIGRQFLK